MKDGKMSQVHGIQYNQREIVLVPFPYTDLTAIKKRPVLILSNNRYNSNHEDIVVCLITSTNYYDDYSINLNNEDLIYGYLPETSTVKVHRLFTIHQDKIIKKFSIVKAAYFDKVINKLNSLIKQSKEKST
jgi:mRNA interferase MazF